MTTLTNPQATSASAVAVMTRMMTEGFATGNTAIVDELVSPDCVEHQFGLEGTGAEAIAHVKAAINDVHGAFPDMSFTLEDSAQSGDIVWARYRGNGHGTGPFFGPPSGRPVSFMVMEVARIVDGLIVEHWGVPDRFAILAQTGVLDRLGGRPA